MKRKSFTAGLAAVLSIFMFLVAPAGSLNAQEKPFYQGKTLTIVVGYAAGGGYDLYARILARHIGRHIPGEPTVIVRNVPGAGSRVAINQLYAETKPDGLTIATFDRDAYTSQLLKHAGILYDLRKLSWIGSASSELSVLQVRTDAGIRSPQDLFTLKSPLIVGDTGVGSSPYVQSRGVETALGLQFKHVTGYKGSSEVAIAIERGEVQAVVGSINSLQTRRPHWLKQGLIRIVLQMTEERRPNLPDVPAAGELAKDEKGRQLIAASVAGNEWARPYAGPPGMPADRLQILRKALAETLKDPKFLAEAKQQKLELEDPMTGEQVEKKMKQVLEMPPDVLENFKRLFEEK
ncbi:MAG: hypothetical protein HYY65_02745 [Candidatus Tectomicrobia bacterium]|uniref:Tripartite tricarboxylate transporter substrate binding protein n=1 Tax=Tectimicrobiota bacterium TaxID=2528274 RepID=A0A932LZU4_UNCTE|nr:hypothetical protein [Candidatus Tectomicrobia bacterium]